MNQVCLKLVEQCLTHSKYDTDSNYFLEIWVGEKEINLFLVTPLGL